MSRVWVLLLLAAPLHAATTVTSDLTITGEAGFGTSAPRARLEVKAGDSDAYAIKVSSQDGSVLLSIDREGNAAIGLESAGARLDAAGTADDGSIGLQLRAGNSSNTVTSSQFVFAMAGTQTFRQSIRTQHDQAQPDYNRVDFFLWNSTGAPNDLGALDVLSVRASSTTTGSVQVLPAGPAPFELVVSDGETIGGGTIQFGRFWQQSSRARKTDIRYAGKEDIRKAYEDLKALKHVIFRYKSANSREKRGLIYEDAPESVRGPAGTLSTARRLALLEMALQETGARLDALEEGVSRMERGEGYE